MRIEDLPLPVLSDAYKASHFRSYPKSKEMIAVRFLRVQLRDATTSITSSLLACF